MIGSIITRGYGLEPGYVITRGFSTGLEVEVGVEIKGSGNDHRRKLELERLQREAIMRDDDEVMQIVAALMGAANGVFS